MAYLNENDERRISGTRTIKYRPETVAAACIAEAAFHLDATRTCLVRLSNTESPVIATRGTSLSAEERTAACTWTDQLTRTQVQAVPAALHHALRAFRALCAPICSPAAEYGVVLVSSPTGEICSHELRRQLDAVATEWALRLEEDHRASLRQMGNTVSPDVARVAAALT